MADIEGEFTRALHEELDKRVNEISGYAPDTFGLISYGELLACTVVSILVPVALVWVCR